MIPVGWTESTVDDEFEVQLGKRLDAAVNKGELKLCINNRGVRWGFVEVVEAVWAPLTKADIRDLRLVIGDVLVCEGGEIGRSSVWRGELADAYYLNTLHRLRSRGRYDPDLLVAFLDRWAKTGELLALVGKSSLAHLTKENLLRVRLPMPSNDEQERITNILGAVDRLIESLVRLASKKRDIKQGMVQELLTGKTRLPGFNAPWTTIRLGDHVSFVKTVALSRAQLNSNSPLKYLHYGDIHTRSTSILDAAFEDMPRAPRSRAGTAGRLQVGDLVFADASEDPAGVGRSVEITGVPAGGVIPGLHTIAARFDKRVLADGFKAYLQDFIELRKQLLSRAAGTKVLATTRKYISDVELILPEVSEQLAIARALREADDQIQAAERRLESARGIKQGMMQELLTGRTRLVEGVAA